MKTIKLFLLLPFSLFLCHCTSVNVVLPLATIESPEALGRTWQVEMGPSLEPAVGIQYTADASNRPPDVSNPSYLGDTHSLQHEFDFGIAERFQWGVAVGWDTVDDAVGVDGSISESYTLAGKFQFLGPSRIEAKGGDWSGGIFAKYIYGENSASGDQNSTFGAGGFPWNANVLARSLMAGVTIGHRIYSNWLVYAGGSYQDIQTTITVNQDPASDNSDPGGVYQVDRNGSSMAYGLGTQLNVGKVFALNLKVMQVNFELEGLEDRDSLTAAGGVSFSW